ncbi:hypothetical protein KY285_010480 [Solanum tuberosum]|nr:hypothetical protein KY289_012754 [Solanum tuberosum]KAH0734773.1 hypothetical protein KY285_010480 [Solanum tuberosum]
MLQGRDLHLTDNGKLSNSWNEYIISLRSGYVTLRHDSNFIMESYSPIRFSRKFGFCQDVPGDLMERPYDVMIPTCPLKGAPLMSREYVDWWPSQRLNTSQGNLRIIFKKTKQDSTSISPKGASDQSKEKSHPYSKSKVKSNDTLQVAKTSSKSKTSKDRDVPVKSKLRRLILASKATSPAPKVGHGSSGTNELHVSSDNVPPTKSPSNDGMPSLEGVLPRKSPSRPLRPGAPTLEPQETIYRAKSTFVSEMWGALCGWITQFSLEDHVENFFKSYTEYDTLRSSKMTKESHEKTLSDAQRRLDGAKLAHEKLDGSMDKLQATLADVEKDLKALTSKKKKVTALINKYQEKLSKSQENVTITEGEIYTIEANNVMSNNEVERLAKLEGAVKKSRQEIINFKLFP